MKKVLKAIAGAVMVVTAAVGASSGVLLLTGSQYMPIMLIEGITSPWFILLWVVLVAFLALPFYGYLEEEEKKKIN